MWECLFRAGKFIREIGEPLASSLQYSYPMEDDVNVTDYLIKVKKLPG
ncbi:MAG: aminoglycoside 6-adenylyltransferase [Tissierella sp.]|nr:aminoglycoside 6-adenylyltransferase [Tissierella sp.]